MKRLTMCLTSVVCTKETHKSESIRFAQIMSWALSLCQESSVLTTGEHLNSSTIRLYNDEASGNVSLPVELFLQFCRKRLVVSHRF